MKKPNHQRQLVGRVSTIGSIWAIAAGLFYCYDILRDTGRTLTARGRPLGDDFVNFWSGAKLAWSGRAAEVYDWPAYHAFQESVVGSDLGAYNYSYSPVLLLLTAAAGGAHAAEVVVPPPAHPTRITPNFYFNSVTDLDSVSESFQADFPDELMDALRLRALKEKTSVKALVLRSLHDSGYPVSAEFLEDKRRRGR